MLDTGASLEARGWLENTALHVAAQAAQVNIIHELLQRGLAFDVTNAHGEHPIHLAAGSFGDAEDIRHVEILLEAGVNIKKSRTDEGCTAAHYAAKSGSPETLRLLLDAECPVTKAKMNEDLRWYTVNVGDTLLELTAKSGCPLKGALVLDRIMAAR